jgi:hypothetical protein
MVKDATLNMPTVERERAQREIATFAPQLRGFEHQYNMKSEVFYRRFQQGELGDAADFFAWSAVYAMHQAALERLESLTASRPRMIPRIHE